MTLKHLGLFVRMKKVVLFEVTNWFI